MRTPDQRHLLGADHATGRTAVFHPDRPRAARRGYKLSLPSALGLEHRARASSLAAGWRLRGRSPRTHRRDVDDRCTLPRDGGRHRCGAITRHSCGRDGSGWPLCIRSGPGSGRHMPRPCDEPDGYHRGRLREGRGERHGRCFGGGFADCRQSRLTGLSHRCQADPAECRNDHNAPGLHLPSHQQHKACQGQREIAHVADRAGKDRRISAANSTKADPHFAFRAGPALSACRMTQGS